MATAHKLALMTSALLLLNGCGSSDNAIPPLTSAYSLSGTISGLTGTVVIGINSGTTTISQNGAITLGNRYQTGDVVTLQVKQQPQDQECKVTSRNPVTFLSADINTVTIACENLPQHSISGKAEGLARAVTLKYQASAGAAGSLVVDQNGNFEFADKVVPGATLTFSVNGATGHSCEITPAQVTVNQDINNLQLSCTTFGKLYGQVSSYNTGNPISAADIAVYIADQAGSPKLLDTTTSDDEGRFSIDAVGYQQRLVVRSAAAGYASRSDIALTSEDNPQSNISVALVAADVVTTFDAAAAATLTDPDSAMQVVLPAAAFVYADGQAATGEITAELTNVDASSDPAIMPGYYLAIDPTTGNEQGIESFGAINAQFKDAQGNALQLAQGTTATIHIPLAARAITPPATIPLIHFNQQTGVWDVEGEATLKTDERNRPYYEGVVGHFSTWNADVLFNSVNINGCVLSNDTSAGLSSVRVLADGVDYIGRSEAYTNSEGAFQIAVRPNSQILVSVRDTDGQSNTQVVDIGTVDFTLQNCLTLSSRAMTVTLTWGENPRDLDAHFFGPRTENSNDDRFEIYFSNKEETVNNVTMYLDYDDTSSYGPEVLTIPQFPVAGRYRYTVRHYSGSGTIFQAPTRVEARLAGETYVFSPSADEDTAAINDVWVVFDVVVATDGAVTVVPVDSYMRHGEEDINVNAAVSSLRAEKHNKLQQQPYRR